MLELESGVGLVGPDLRDAGQIRRLRTGAIVSQLLRTGQIELRLSLGGRNKEPELKDQVCRSVRISVGLRLT